MSATYLLVGQIGIYISSSSECKYMDLKPARVIVTYILNKGYVMAPALISSPGGAARENNIIT